MSDSEKPPAIDAPADGGSHEVAELAKKEVDVGGSTPSVRPTDRHPQTNSTDVEAAQPNASIDPDPYPPAIKVPISQRRGFLSRFVILAEVENAYHYTRKQKWTITAIVAMCGIAAPLASVIILREYSELFV